MHLTAVHRCTVHSLPSKSKKCLHFGSRQLSAWPKHKTFAAVLPVSCQSRNTHTLSYFAFCLRSNQSVVDADRNCAMKTTEDDRYGKPINTNHGITCSAHRTVWPVRWLLFGLILLQGFSVHAGQWFLPWPGFNNKLALVSQIFVALRQGWNIRASSLATAFRSVG